MVWKRPLWRGIPSSLSRSRGTLCPKALTGAGFLAALIPEEYGGSGLTMPAAAAIMEEIHAAGCNGAACHAQGALLVVDASQCCGAIPLDVKTLGADLVTAAAYKWLLGPYGTNFVAPAMPAPASAVSASVALPMHTSPPIGTGEPRPASTDARALRRCAYSRWWPTSGGAAGNKGSPWSAIRGLVAWRSYRRSRAA